VQTVNNQVMVGIGCFAKPEVLSRVLKRMVETYILGTIEGLASDCGFQLGPLDLKQLLKLIFNGGVEHRTSPDGDGYKRLENKTITGFFLKFEEQGLNLSVFTRESGVENGRYSANLYEFKHLRRKRLN
jgi:hypothetical protein